MAWKRFIQLGAVATLAIAVPGAVAAKKPLPQGSAKIDSLLKCRSVTDPAQRLACFDANVATLGTAIASKDVIIVDRKRAEEANHQLFGFAAPAIGQLFGIGDLDHIDSTLKSSGYNSEGGITVTLADGSRWSQQDDKAMFGSLRPGTPVTVVRGLMGSYVVRIKGQIGFKAIRIG